MPKKRKFNATFIEDLDSGKNTDKRTTKEDLLNALDPKRKSSPSEFSKSLKRAKNR